MKKVLITGANGLLGQKIVGILSPAYKILACDLGPEFFLSSKTSYNPLDIREKDKLMVLVKSFKSNWIINCASYTNVDGCEKNQTLAWSVNVDGVKNIVEVCQKLKINLIHFSTDYVFDGKNGPYGEEDKTAPIDFYGKTKLESERIIEHSHINFTIIRTNVLYGCGEKVKSNFFLWVLENLRKNKKIKVVEDQYNNPTLAFNLAQIVKEIVDKDIFGLYHIGGRDWLSRFEFAQKIALSFGFDRDKIEPIQTSNLKQIAPRPLKGGLKIDKAKKVFKTEIWGIEKSLGFLKGNC
ncbi:MAG: dTDP-4-dehydrorhamnose reductase [candidate division Zixibacteria bacterium]|nr:dTDP-4-dehydrorhamnose reductase [candidate division Zixibacteria bacterium]